MEKKKTSPVFWIALIAIAAAAYIMTEPQAPAKKTTAGRTTSKKKVTASLYTDEDFKAKFSPVNNPVKNAFMPLVAKGATGQSGTPNGLPSDLTGGETGWTYTGTASVDGRIQAVVENLSTGQGDFLTFGQKWKTSRVVAVTETSLTLEGTNGQTVTVKMQEKLSNIATLAPGFAPVNVTATPALQGQIGSVTIRPDGNLAGASASEGEGNAN